jgi:hypothetical protein
VKHCHSPAQLVSPIRGKWFQNYKSDNSKQNRLVMLKQKIMQQNSHVSTNSNCQKFHLIGSQVSKVNSKGSTGHTRLQEA